jgi:hypothetical protein
VTVEPVVKYGVTPVETLMFGVMVPEYNSFPAPVGAVPKLKYLAVVTINGSTLVQAGNVMLAAGDTEFAVTVKPEVDRATAART